MNLSSRQKSHMVHGEFYLRRDSESERAKLKFKGAMPFVINFFEFLRL
jgi:hypothetical protein